MVGLGEGTLLQLMPADLFLIGAADQLVAIGAVNSAAAAQIMP
jgi:hypothetical protein